MKQRFIILTCALLSVLNPVLSQPVANHIGCNKPWLIPELHYTQSGGYRQAVAGLSIGVIRTHTYSFQGQARSLGIEVGRRFSSAGPPDIVWRYTLMDFEANDLENEKYFRKPCRPYFCPSAMDGRAELPASSFFPSHGVTLLDYNRSGIAELDARWAPVQVRLRLCAGAL